MWLRWCMAVPAVLSAAVCRCGCRGGVELVGLDTDGVCAAAAVSVHASVSSRDCPFARYDNRDWSGDDGLAIMFHRLSHTGSLCVRVYAWTFPQCGFARTLL